MNVYVIAGPTVKDDDCHGRASREDWEAEHDAEERSDAGHGGERGRDGGESKSVFQIFSGERADLVPNSILWINFSIAFFQLRLKGNIITSGVHLLHIVSLCLIRILLLVNFSVFIDVRWTILIHFSRIRHNLSFVRVFFQCVSENLHLSDEKGSRAPSFLAQNKHSGQSQIFKLSQHTSSYSRSLKYFVLFLLQ